MTKLMMIIFLLIPSIASAYNNSYEAIDESSLRHALDVAQSGDIVILDAEIHVTDDLMIGEGVTLWGRPDSKLVNNGPYMVWIRKKESSRMQNIFLLGLKLEGVGIFFKGQLTENSIVNIPSKTSTQENFSKIKGVKFSKGKDYDLNNPELHRYFSNRNNDPHRTPYIAIINADGVLVDDNELKRTSEAVIGKGVLARVSSNIVVQSNDFHENFQNAVNGSLVYHMLVHNNNVRRTNIGFQEALIDKKEDHGIYIGSFSNVEIIDNLVTGYSNTSAGMSIKLRDGQGATVTGNYLRDSGILLASYKEYSNKAPIPDRFRRFLDITVADNVIILDETTTDYQIGDGSTIPQIPMADLSCNHRSYFGLTYQHLANSDNTRLTIANNVQWTDTPSWSYSGQIKIRQDSRSTAVLSAGHHSPSSNINLINNTQELECIYLN